MTLVGILRHQGVLLGRKTGNLVFADVRLGTRSANELSFVFELVAPALGFRHPLLTVSHKITSPFPATVSSGSVPGIRPDYALPPGKKADTPEEFLERVKEVLGSDETVNIVKTLLVQSRDFADE